MRKILVTGANGQLGRCIQDAAAQWPTSEFYFETRESLDVANEEGLERYFMEHDIDHCINAAAYTNVEKAESDKENAFSINADGARNLALMCKKHNAVLWHISTDYVYDGTKNTPYLETDAVNPINVYGASKLKGEEYIQEVMDRYFIIRTSWLYSQYGHNFYKSMLRLAQDRDSLTITTEQIGTPTNANDLARAVLEMIDANCEAYGIYHFSNGGEATWYDFAREIIKVHGLDDRVKVDKTDYYPTFAKRPAYSVMDLSKVLEQIETPVKHWAESLENLVKKTVS